MKVPITYSPRHKQRVQVQKRKEIVNSLLFSYLLALLVLLAFLVASTIEFRSLG